MSADVWLGVAMVVVFIIATQYEFAYIAAMVTALQAVQDYGRDA